MARLYQAKVISGEPAASARLAEGFRGLLPPVEYDQDFWAHGLAVDDTFALWEISPRGDARVERRLVVIGANGRDPELSAWTWSRGHVAMPPIARYLMYAAKLRHHVRAWAGGQRVRHLRLRVADTVQEARRPVKPPHSLPGSGWIGAEVDAYTRLLADQTRIAAVLTEMLWIQNDVTMVTTRMADALGRLLPEQPAEVLLDEDATLASGLTKQLGEETARLERLQAEVRRVVGILASISIEQPASQAPRARAGCSQARYRSVPRLELRSV